VNSCVIGSPDRGCIITDAPRPNFKLSDERQSQLFVATDDNSISVNPLIGRGNDALIVGIANAPVNLPPPDCKDGDTSCGTAEGD
jgi:hypothetical protein